MVWSETISLIAIFVNVITFVLGQFSAIKIMRHLDEKKAAQSRKTSIYKTLMATRAASLSPAHVEALNSIPLEFTKQSPPEKDVISAWKTYLDWLNVKVTETNNWNTKRIELYTILLQKMGICLGYNFEFVDIKNGIYYPVGHGAAEEDSDLIRRGLRDLLNGKTSLKVDINTSSFPSDASST